MKKIVILLIILLFSELVHCQNDKKENKSEISYNLTKEQKDAILAYSKIKNGWTVATAEDNTDKEGIKKKRAKDPGFEPYYVSSDMTGDGINDFAIVIKKKGSTGFGIVWFLGEKGGKYVPQWMGETYLHEGCIKSNKKGLWIYLDISCKKGIFYYWSSKYKALVNKASFEE
jgi:hypothetical protein